MHYISLCCNTLRHRRSSAIRSTGSAKPKKRLTEVGDGLGCPTLRHTALEINVRFDGHSRPRSIRHRSGFRRVDPVNSRVHTMIGLVTTTQAALQPSGAAGRQEVRMRSCQQIDATKGAVFATLTPNFFTLSWDAGSDVMTPASCCSTVAGLSDKPTQTHDSPDVSKFQPTDTSSNACVSLRDFEFALNSRYCG